MAPYTCHRVARCPQDPTLKKLADMSLMFGTQSRILVFAAAHLARYTDQQEAVAFSDAPTSTENRHASEMYMPDMVGLLHDVAFKFMYARELD